MQGMGVLAAGAALGAAADVQAGVRLAGVRGSAYTLNEDENALQVSDHLQQLL